VRLELERPSNETRHSSDLTPNEQEHVRVAIPLSGKAPRDVREAAKAVGRKRKTLSNAGQRSVSAGIALRIATVAGVTLEEVLGGRWPVDGVCSHCGRAGRAEQL
jgi:hypothetical protein